VAGWITASVQLGFVCGALFSALMSLSDRIDVRVLFTICALAGAAFNAAIALVPMSFYFALALRAAGVPGPPDPLGELWLSRAHVGVVRNVGMGAGDAARQLP
jgi:hypothetical protein